MDLISDLATQALQPIVVGTALVTFIGFAAASGAVGSLVRNGRRFFS